MLISQEIWLNLLQLNRRTLATKLLSDICYVDKFEKDIEEYLCANYGSVIRWAIVEVYDNKYKVSFTYEK